MKKFKRILYAVLVIVAVAVYFAEELSHILQDVEQEKKEMSKTVSKLQKEASKSARKVAEEAKEAAQEVGKQVKGKAQKKSGTKRDVPAQLEIPAMKGKTASQIIEYTGHTLSYNSRTRLPNWVAYELTRKEAQGDNPRKDKFARCPQAQGPQADKEDYRNSGWDRGHMAPAGDMMMARCLLNTVGVPDAKIDFSKLPCNAEITLKVPMGFYQDLYNTTLQKGKGVKDVAAFLDLRIKK